MLSILLLAALGGCEAAVPPVPLRIAVPKGPAGMPMAALMGAEYAAQYAITLCDTPEAAMEALRTDAADVAAVGLSQAARLHKALSSDAVLLAATGLGALHVLENGDTVHAPADLAGRTLYLAAGEEAGEQRRIVTYLLTQSGVPDARLRILPAQSEVLARLRTEPGALGLLGAAQTAWARGEEAALRVALDVSALWQAAFDAPLCRSVLVARQSYAVAHPAVLRAFLTDYTAAVAFVNGRHEKASLLVIDRGLMRAEEPVRKSIALSQLVCLRGEALHAGARRLAAALALQGADGPLPEAFFGGVPSDGGGE